PLSYFISLFVKPPLLRLKRTPCCAARTDLPGELLLDVVPFPFPALVFMLPKGTIRHPIGGDCPYVVVSRTEKGQVTSLPLKDIGDSCAAPKTAVTTSTYVAEELMPIRKEFVGFLVKP